FFGHDSETAATMSPVQLIVTFLGYSVAAGALGALAMAGVIKLITRSGWARSDMVIAVGSLLTGSRESARLVGRTLHALSGVGFAMVYAVVMMALNLTKFPEAAFAGIGFGIFHGMVVSLTLCWIVAEQHPLDEFKNAGLAVGVSHLAGHVAYGLVVGLVIGFSGL
ncbi:MAG: hypothetical protein KGJ37_01265, partial [Verrucomicrobiota bacterium]|nr:hypothetical protein [Verrucomicrobiota bacterium]